MTSNRRRLRVAALATATVATLAAGVSPAVAVVPTGIQGVDTASYQGNVNWAGLWSAGYRFAYVKATESTNYVNPYFAQQYNGSYNVGMIRGAYHYAHPSGSSATAVAQADYFVDHGGGWSPDGKTLPGALDLEGGCWGIAQSTMVTWIANFAARYKTRTGRDVVIYTTTSWWKTCTGNSSRFATTNPLWIAIYNNATSPGTLPAGWRYDTFWQYSGTTLDKDRFNGDMAGLKRMATG